MVPKAPFHAVAEKRGWDVVEWRERNKEIAPDLANEWAMPSAAAT